MHRLLALFVVFFMILTQMSWAQQKPITGKVTDELSGEALPGVTVVVEGTTLGTTTDFDGNYSIAVSNGQSLVFSYIGYEKSTILIQGQTELNVILGVNTEDLGEVVIIGYGTVKKDDATGSVTAISSEDFNMGAISSPQELIMGKSAGVVVTAPNGQPGAGATIRIRGGSSLRASNDPLIVIDGFPIDNTGISGLSNPLSTINPNDIESMTVLKDASATAIYGSRASNGVIIITTKKGKTGAPIKVSYNGNASIGVPIAYQEVLTGDQMRTLVQERVDEGIIKESALERLGDANTDWQNEIYQNALTIDQNISVTGTVKNVPYRASIGYLNNNGILKYSKMDRTTLDLSASPSLFDNHLKVKLNLKGIDINNNFSNQGAIGSAVSFDPTQPITNGNTAYGGYTAWVDLGEADPLNGKPTTIATSNPVALLEFADNISDVNRLIANAQLDYKFHNIPELRANLNVGYDMSQSEGHNITSKLASWSYRDPQNNVIEYNQKLKKELFEFYLNYNKDLPEISSNIDATAGYSWQHFYREGASMNRPHDMTDGEYVGADTTAYKNENYLISFFGRVNYSLMNKYLVTFTLREDGSSRFGKENRWGLFPSAAFAWKIKEETFLKGVKQLTEMKLRLGWGITGQQDVSDQFYPYIPTYKTSNISAAYQFGDKFYRTYRPNPYNASLKWEETTTYNIGLDFGLFEDKLVGSFDVYQRNTDNLINEIPIPIATNFSNFLLSNVGSLVNKGVEASITYRPVVTQDLLVEFCGTFTYNQNKITSMTAVEDPDYSGYPTGGISGGVGNNVQFNSVGQPVNAFFLYQQVYDTEWKPIEGLYVDRSGDEESIGEGDNARKYFAETPAADYLVGLNAKVIYKQFDFVLNGRISIGNLVYNNNASSNALLDNLYNQAGFFGNIPTDVYKTNFKTAQYWSDFYLEDASFLRIDNINLGYSFNEVMGNKLSGRIGLTIQNALVYTKYSGLDPEVDGGIDNNIYPRPRIYMLGLNINF